MSKSLAVTKYQIVFKARPEGKSWFAPDPVDITEEQYRKIAPLLNDYKFIEVGSETYNTSSVEEIRKVIIEPHDYLLKIGDTEFYTQSEVDSYLEEEPCKTS